MAPILKVLEDAEISCCSNELPSVLLIAETSILALPVAVSAGSLVLALPNVEDDVIGQEFLKGAIAFQDSSRVPLAAEGTWDTEEEGVEADVRFVCVSGDAIVYNLLEHVDFEGLAPEDIVGFEAGTFAMPMRQELLARWRSVEPQRRSVPPPVARGRATRTPTAGTGYVTPVEFSEGDLDGTGAQLVPGRTPSPPRGDQALRAAPAPSTAPAAAAAQPLDDDGRARTGRRPRAAATRDGEPKTVAALNRAMQEQMRVLEERVRLAEAAPGDSAGRLGTQDRPAAGIPGGGRVRSPVGGSSGNAGGVQASGGLGLAGALGPLGLGGGGIDRSQALQQARSLLGIGGGGLAEEGAAMSAQVGGGFSMGQRETFRPPPGLPPATAPNSSTAEGEEGRLLERLVRIMEGRQNGSSRGNAESFGLGAPAASSYGEYLGGSGGGAGGGGGDFSRSANLERVLATRRQHPEVVIAANDRAIQDSLHVLPGESWSVSRHARQDVIPQCGGFSTLRRVVAVLAAALDEGRLRGGLHQHAFLYHAYRVFELAAAAEDHDVAWSWPLLGIDDPAGRPRAGLAPVESAGLAAFHRDELALAQSRASAGRRGRGGGGATGDGLPQFDSEGGRGAARRAAAAAKRAADGGGKVGAAGNAAPKGAGKDG